MTISLGFSSTVVVGALSLGSSLPDCSHTSEDCLIDIVVLLSCLGREEEETKLKQWLVYIISAKSTSSTGTRPCPSCPSPFPPCLANSKQAANTCGNEWNCTQLTRELLNQCVSHSNIGGIDVEARERTEEKELNCLIFLIFIKWTHTVKK